MRNTWLSVSLCVAFVGCGHHGPGQDMATPEDMAVGDDLSIGDMGIPDDAKKAVSYTQYALDYANAWCTHLMKCGRLDMAQFALCVENNTIYYGWDIDSEIMKGHLEINELQCLNAISTARCDDSDEGVITDRCISFFNIPLQANGATCLSDFECTSAFCQHAGVDAGTGQVQNSGCPGTCQPPKAPSSPCFGSQSSECGPHGFCNAPDNNSPGSCELYPTLGQDCSTVGFCDFGLECPTFGTQKCVSPATQTTAGGACDPALGANTDMPSCADGYYCQIQYDNSTTPTAETGGKCVAQTAANLACDRKEMGTLALGDYSFVQSDCVAGTVCTPTAQDVTSGFCKPWGASGDDCYRISGLVSTCKAGLYCAGGTATALGKCTPLLADGQPCTSSGQCAAVSNNGGTCIADNADAGAFLTCNKARGFGAACNPGFDDGLCSGSTGSGTTYCAPTATGGACSPKCL